MKQFISFVRKEFYHIFRDLRTMLILLGMPVVQIILFGFAITTEVKNVKDTAFCYFLHVEEFLGKDEQRPLDFARKEIKEILINLKRVDFINKVKEELYQRASDRNKINYYYLNSNE